MPRVVVVSLLLLLTACAGPSPRDYEFAPPITTGGRLCLIQCQQAREFCREQCGLQSSPCYRHAEQRAVQAYDQYLIDMAKIRQTPEKKLHDFMDASSCQSVTCRDDCDGAYRTCYSGCGGEVIPAY